MFFAASIQALFHTLASALNSFGAVLHTSVVRLSIFSTKSKPHKAAAASAKSDPQYCHKWVSISRSKLPEIKKYVLIALTDEYAYSSVKAIKTYFFISGNLLREIETHLWQYCGSDFALAAAALCGFDLVEKIESLTTDVCNTAPKEFKAEAKVWKRAWIEAAKNIDNRIIRYIESLLFIYYPERIVNSEVADSDGFGRDCSSSAAGFKPHKDNILDDMFNPPDAKKQKWKSNNFAEELKHFQGLGLCLKDPVSFFSRIGDEFLMLKRVAKILLSIPVSSAMDRAAVQ